jgi:hypothetical protein
MTRSIDRGGAVRRRIVRAGALRRHLERRTVTWPQDFAADGALRPLWLLSVLALLLLVGAFRAMPALTCHLPGRQCLGVARGPR